MQDIDFDEIDRAVNSVSGTTETADVQVNTAPSPTPSLSPAARRSSGRFMDVVHPSSDMRTAVPARPVESEPPVEAAVPERTAEADTGVAFHWPDPVASAPSVEVESVTLDEPLLAAEPGQEVPEDDDAPLDSPFLSGAQVDKRPLGAFSGADAGLPLIEDALPPIAVEAPQLDEASQVEEMMAFEEREDVNPEQGETPVALDETTQDEPVAEPIVTEETYIPEAPQSFVDEPTGPASITPQYQEHPSSEPESTGSMYDTEAYHQPFAKPAKKKHSALLVVVWIISLIVVGAGIGVGVYYFVLPMIG